MYKIKEFFKKCVNQIPIICVVLFIIFVIFVASFTAYYFNFYSQSNLKDYFEILAAAVSIFSMIFVIFQVVLFVDDSREKNKRSKKEYSAEMAIKYAREILPEISFIRNVFLTHYTEEEYATLLRIKPKLFNQKEGNSLLSGKFFEPFNHNCNVINYDIFVTLCSMSNLYRPEKCNCVEQDKKKKAYNDEFRMVLIKSINQLEAFSLILIEDLADERILYPILHQTFLENVKLIYPFISMKNTTVEDKYFPNITELYKRWEQRNEQEQIKISETLKKKK